jgi:hypothetical protein
MPIYRISRYVVTEAIDIEADSPEQAQVLLAEQPLDPDAPVSFSHTVIEERLPEPSRGYREETSADVITIAKAERDKG